MNRFTPYVLRDAVHWYVHFIAVIYRSIYLFWLKLLPNKTFRIHSVRYNDAKQWLELYVPKANNRHRCDTKPLIVFVHGGAWTFGFGSRRDFYSHCLHLVKQGYPVATVGYRLSPQYRYPYGYNDVREAIYWLKKNSPRYLSPKKPTKPCALMLIGHSAGAHLSLLMALKDKDLPVDSVISLAGPSDLSNITACKVCDIEKKIFLNGVDPSEVSPITYTRKDAPAITLYHGDTDGVVDVSQSQMLYAKLRSIGAKATIHILKDKGHWFPFVSSKNMLFDQDILDQILKVNITDKQEYSIDTSIQDEREEEPIKPI